MLVQYNKETGKNEFPIGSALLNILSPTRRKANYENMKSDQSRLQDFFSNSMVPEIFGSKSAKEKEDMFKRLQNEMKTEKGRDTASTLYGQAKQNNYDLTDKKNTYGKGLEKFNEAVEKSGSIAQSAAGGVAGAFEKIKASGIAAKAGAFAANVGIGLAASALMQLGAMALSWVGTKIKKAATYDKDKIEAADKTRTNYQDKLSDTKTNISTLKGNKTEFESLSKGVDEYGNNISLDTSSYERFLNIRKEILDTTPSLISGYDAEGNAIAKTSGLIDKAIESQEKKLKSTQKDYSSDATWDKLNKGNQESLKKAAGGLLDKSLSKDIESTRKNISDEIYKRTSSSGDSFGKAFGDATKKVIGGKKALDLTKDADISKFANNYSKIFDQMKEDNPSISTEAIEANVSKYVARYNKMMKEIKSLAKQYKEDFQNTVSASDGYDKLSSKGQSFLSGIAGNIIDFDNANEKDLTDDNISKKRKDLQKITKEFTKNKKAQEDLDELVKTTNKTGGKSAKKWSEDVQDAYNDLTKTLGKKVDGKTLSAALEDAFDFKFSKDGDILHNGKNVEDMISSIQGKLGDNKDTTKFLDGLDFTEMSQAFDILNSKTEKWTGSLDQLKERLKLINQTKSQSTWSDYLQAKETADSGDTYLAMREAFNAQKKERDKGLIGTDDFKTLTSVMSSSGKTDAATFDKTWAKTTKYFTEDATGLVKFLDDLSAKSKQANNDFGKVKQTANGDWKINLNDNTAAANSMGMGIESFESVLNRLKDYGYNVKFTSITDNWNQAETQVNKLADAWDQLQDGKYKTKLGLDIEDYRQKILEAQKLNKKIPDKFIKKLELQTNLAEVEQEIRQLTSEGDTAKKQGNSKKALNKYESANSALQRESATLDQKLQDNGTNKTSDIKKQEKALESLYQKYRKLSSTDDKVDFMSKKINPAIEKLISSKKKLVLTVDADTSKAKKKIVAIKDPSGKIVYVTAKDLATKKIEGVERLKINGKTFVIYADDQGTQKIQEVDGKTISDKKFNIVADVTTNMPSYMKSLFLSQGTAHANGTIKQSALDKAATKIKQSNHSKTDKKSNGKVVTKKDKQKQAIDDITNRNLFNRHFDQGSAHVHGTMVPLSKAYAQGTFFDDLIDFDDEYDFADDDFAIAHGTIPKLSCRALALGSLALDNGDWGLKQDERALTGELGTELVV